nr:Gag-Pol polyprotein [Tanacetum cinerariifolium]
PKRRDAAYLQTQLLIAQKEEVGIQLQAEEFDLMAVAADLDEIKEVNANCILMANLQQASSSGSDIRIQEKKAKLFNEWERFTSNEGESIESYYHWFLKLMNDLKRNKHFPEKIASNLKFLNNLQPGWSRHNGLIGVQGNENHNQIGNGNLVAARAEGNAAAQNGNQIRCYNCRGV